MIVQVVKNHLIRYALQDFSRIQGSCEIKQLNVFRKKIYKKKIRRMYFRTKPKE